MDLAQSFDEVVSLVNGASGLNGGWDSLRDYLEGKSPGLSDEVDDVDISQDVAEVADQVRLVLEAEPPPDTVDAIYFGLFDTVEDSGDEGIGFYVAGAADYSTGGDDALCDPAWWPDRRYLLSDALSALRRVEAARDGDERAFLSYAGQLGIALLVTKFVVRGLFEGKAILVGFDSGDVAKVR